jgi:hypothetical protein
MDKAYQLLIKFFRTINEERGPQHGEIRWALDEWEGKPFVSVRIWARRGNDIFPTKSGITIRASELDQVIDVLSKARTEIRKRQS